MSLLRPNDTNFSIWVADIKRQLGIATQASVIKVNATVAINQFPLNNLSLLRPIDARFGLWEAYFKNTSFCSIS